ncbi:MAG: HD domain-containing protein [Acidimicrobiia bacterium]
MSTPVVDEILSLFADYGAHAYGGERVSQLDHALQSAWCAGQDGGADPLIVAALVHDVGHLLAGKYMAAEGLDDEHERTGAEYLGAHFPPAVSEPVRLHVAAKRYLCVVESTYADALSEGSILSLELQGGPMRPDEAKAFEAEQFSADAIRLRRYDDDAKRPDALMPALGDYEQLLKSLVRA